jgi:TRAP-type C4-dicarboxylate transport system permease large subunit
MITPPVGSNLFVLKSVLAPEVSFKDIVLESLPFVFVLMLGLVLLMIFPEIVLWLLGELLRIRRFSMVPV